MLSAGLFSVFTLRILPSVPNSEGNEKGERLFLFLSAVTKSLPWLVFLFIEFNSRPSLFLWLSFGSYTYVTYGAVSSLQRFIPYSVSQAQMGIIPTCSPH